MKYYCHRIVLFLLFVPVLFAFSTQRQNSLFSGENSFKYLLKQCEFGPRNPGSAGHAACLKYLIDELKKSTPDVSTQPFFHLDKDLNKSFQMHNVIGRFPGKNPDAQGILLAAHWDTRPRADYEEDPALYDTPISGANDGASGVAVLLEMAKILAGRPPPVPVDIVLFDGEDYGKEGESENYFLGARHFAKQRHRSYEFGILIDMIGEKNLRIPMEAYSLRMLPELVKKVWKRARKLGLPAFVNREGPEVGDDHEPLIKAGIPIIDIIDFDYDYWHTLEDTPDKCSPKSLKQIGDLLVSLVYDGL